MLKQHRNKQVQHGTLHLSLLLMSFIFKLFISYLIFLFVISHDLQKRVKEKEQEKQKILEETKELTEKNAKISQEMEKMNQELKNVEQ